MHYVTRRSYRMQKHKFGVMCTSVLFVESVPVPPQHKKLCIDVSHTGHTGMHCMTRKSHRMQKHKFSIMCPSTFFCGIPTGHTQAQKIVHRHFAPQTHRNALREPQIPPDAKTIGVSCPSALFVESILVHPMHEKLCDDISHPEHTGMHYVTRRSHWMQNQKFGITCPIAFSWNPYMSHPSIKNSVSTFHTPAHRTALRFP
jgi:hypothetical protein